MLGPPDSVLPSTGAALMIIACGAAAAAAASMQTLHYSSTRTAQQVHPHQPCVVLLPACKPCKLAALHMRAPVLP
jgi:hypothetical protein